MVSIFVVGCVGLSACRHDPVPSPTIVVDALVQCQKVAAGLGQTGLEVITVSGGVVPDGVPAGTEPGLVCTMAAPDGTLHSVFVADDGTQISLPDDAAANSVPPPSTDG